MNTFVTYEQFGAVGDGIADDLAAVVKAHEYANANHLPVKTDPKACYYLSGRALTASVQTDTDWNDSKFIIDDRAVENNKVHIFDIQSSLSPLALDIPRLKKGQESLEQALPQDCFINVTNDHVKQFIRFGLNQNNGTSQTDCFVARKDGTISNEVIWDFDTITQVIALPIDESTLTIKGGMFTTLANGEPSSYNYYARGIHVQRSNVLIEGVSHFVIMEGDTGAPYHGFFRIDDCANVLVKNCYFTGRKIYETIGAAKLPVSMGSYDISIYRSINVRCEGCRQFNITDTTRWGVYTSNFCKDLSIDDCVFSRWDAHMGCTNVLIKDSSLGHQCLNAIGHGQLTVENVHAYGGRLINLRGDYGCLWDGDLLVKDCVWHLRAGTSGAVSILAASQQEDHDFGYACTMPHNIVFENILVDDSQAAEDFQGVFLFSDYNPLVIDQEIESTHPYQLPSSLTVRDVRTVSGKEIRLCSNPILAARFEKAFGREPDL
jgi:hypothetical protein